MMRLLPTADAAALSKQLSMDINGYDAAAKLIVLMNVFMKAGLTPDDVRRTGIESVSADKVRDCAANQKKIKLICHGRATKDGFEATVSPQEIALTDMYASVDSTTSVVTLTTDLMGTLSIVEHQPKLSRQLMAFSAICFGYLTDFRNNRQNKKSV